MGCGGLIAQSSPPHHSWWGDGWMDGLMEPALYYVWGLHPAGLSKSLIAANFKDLLPVVCQFWQSQKIKIRGSSSKDRHKLRKVDAPLWSRPKFYCHFCTNIHGLQRMNTLTLVIPWLSVYEVDSFVFSQHFVRSTKLKFSQKNVKKNIMWPKKRDVISLHIVFFGWTSLHAIMNHYELL